jgi:peptidoglycan hydrolase CwlO-like protein
VRQVLSDIEQRHQAQLDDMKEAYDERIHQLLLQQETDMKALEADCQARIHQLNEEMQAAAVAFQEQLAALNDQIADRDSHIYALEQEKQNLAEEILVCEARIKAIRTTHGETLENEDFTQKEHFDRLEKEYKAFARFYRANWSKTKKSIRSQLLNFQYLKGKSKQ